MRQEGRDSGAKAGAVVETGEGARGPCGAARVLCVGGGEGLRAGRACLNGQGLGGGWGRGVGAKGG